MDFQSPLLPISYQEPNFCVTEQEKFKDDADWFLQNNRFIVSQYNLPNISWNADVNENISPVDRGLRLSQYYIGKQTNYTYNHLGEEVGWVKSKIANSLVDRLAGQFIDQLYLKEISAKALSERAENAKWKKWAEIMFKFDHRNDFIHQKLAELGIEYAPKSADEFKDKEDAEKNFWLTTKDSLELYSTDIAKGIEFMNDSDTMYIQSFINDFAPANYVGVMNYAENGKIKQKRVPFYNLIFDRSSDDPFVRDGKYCGVIERLSPAQVFKRFPNLNSLQREEIKELARNESYFNGFTTFYNSPRLPCALKRNNDLLVTVASTWWIAPKDLGKKVTEDKYKNKKIVNVKDGEKDSEFSISDLHKSVVVGNKFLVDWGYESNVVRSVEKKADPQLPIWVFNANTTMGDGISILGKIAPLIDDIDLYRKKLTDTVAKSKGKCYVFLGNKLDKNLKDMITDFAVMGVTTVIGTSGENDDPNNQKRIVEGVDMTLDPNVTAYISLRQALENEIEQLLSMPKIAQGLQTSIIGKGVQQGTIAAASSGMTYLWYNFFKFNTLCMNHAVNMARILIASGKHDMQFVVGDRGEAMMKCIKDTMFEDCMIDLSIRDSVQEEHKKILTQIVLGQAQQGLVSLREGIAVLRAGTLNELDNEIKYFDDKREKAQAAQAQRQFQEQQAMQSQEMQTELMKAKVNQEGQDNRTAETNRASLMKEVIKADMKNEQTQEA